MLEDVEKKISTILFFVFGNNEEDVTTSRSASIEFLINQKSSKDKT